MEVKFNDLTKKFGNFTAVDHLTMTMTNGVYGLLGVNGAGKTTMMRMLCTLLKPTSGSITCNGKDIFEMDSEYRNLLGYLPQDFGFYPEFTVQDYLMYIASPYPSSCSFVFRYFFGVYFCFAIIFAIRI